MKAVLIIVHLFLFCLAADVFAGPQFSQAECQTLNEQRREVRKQLRQPYTPEQGAVLREKERELLRLLQYHCKKPTKNPPLIR